MTARADTAPGSIAVTGAAGSLGTSVVELLMSEGCRVVGLVRAQRQAAELEAKGAGAVVGDVRNRADVERLAEGVDAVLHLAAWMGASGGMPEAHAVNVEGTENVLRAASSRGVRRVVLASSIAVHGPVIEGEVTEETPVRAIGDPYGDTKLAAEQRAREVAAQEGIELVVLRPTMIYGPRSGSWTLIPIQTIRRGLPTVIGSGGDLLDAVYVDDVARAFVLAARVPEAAGQTFLIGGERTDWNTFFGHYARMYRTRLRRLPEAPVKGAARLAAAVTGSVTGRPRVIPESIDVMTSRATYNRGKAAAVLGYEPSVDLAEGMRRTERWLRVSGRLRVPATALVTGAASGLGSAVVRELAGQGLLVYATDLEPADVEAAVGADARVLALDVRDPTSIEAARASIEADGEIVDVVVNAAGLARPGALVTQELDEVTLQFDVNAYGPLHVARAFAPAMIERGAGRIVNISSTNGFVVLPFMGAYSAAKHALEALSDALRLELAPFGVDVIVVEPGAMRTPFASRAKGALERQIEQQSPSWSLYLQRFMESSLWVEGGGTDPAVVGRRVARIAMRGGGARVLATLDAIPARAVAMLPASVKDTIFRLAAGLRPIRGDAANAEYGRRDARAEYSGRDAGAGGEAAERRRSDPDR